ncbi:MAG: hypothetical protein C5B45_01535 [Chlamydiae bacterium]|nr:MAG: hypothetical protein C5B45_01535 [Chlamydiota bacterium]
MFLTVWDTTCINPDTNVNEMSDEEYSDSTFLGCIVKKLKDLGAIISLNVMALGIAFKLKKML